jgi:hypothetical protein
MRRLAWLAVLLIAWTPTKPLPKSITGVCFPLADGKVICVEGSTASTFIYDDATSSWSNGPAMTRARQVVRPTQLDDGRIFFPCGSTAESPIGGEIFDPATLTWKATVASPIGYVAAPAVETIKGTRALVVGLPGATIYDASTDTWTKTGTPITPRRRPHLLRLTDNRVMMLAGFLADGTYLASAEIFDPVTGTFSAAGALSTPRQYFTEQLLSDGRVAVMGGSEMTDTGAFLPTIEIFDPVTKTWSLGPKLLTPRLSVSSIRLKDGRVLIAGGTGVDALLTSTEIFDPVSKLVLPAGNLGEGRATPALAFLNVARTRILAAGGYNGGASAAADVFELLANGKPCVGSGECASVSCVDGVCCAKSACAADETCGGVSTPGTCAKKQGTPCASASECGSGFCVDGLCCDRACDGVCEACELSASKGTCATLAPGESPHGSRAKCPGEGACTGLCGGVDAKTCTLFPGASTSCGEPSCKDGVETSASSCDGKGACVAATTAKCEPFTCAERVCKRACALDTDCASGFSCDVRSGRCVFGAKCDGDHTVIVPGSASIDCTPFKCAGSACLTKCGTTSDCVAATTCDTATGACVTSSPAQDEGSGCAFGARSPAGFLAFLLALGALCARSR